MYNVAKKITGYQFANMIKTGEFVPNVVVRPCVNIIDKSENVMNAME